MHLWAHDTRKLLQIQFHIAVPVDSGNHSLGFLFIHLVAKALECLDELVLVDEAIAVLIENSEELSDLLFNLLADLRW